jgi:hypothetical protein
VKPRDSLAEIAFGQSDPRNLNGFPTDKYTGIINPWKYIFEIDDNKKSVDTAYLTDVSDTSTNILNQNSSPKSQPKISNSGPLASLAKELYREGRLGRHLEGRSCVKSGVTSQPHVDENRALVVRFWGLLIARKRSDKGFERHIQPR